MVIVLRGFLVSSYFLLSVLPYVDSLWLPKEDNPLDKPNEAVCSYVLRLLRSPDRKYDFHIKPSPLDLME